MTPSPYRDRPLLAELNRQLVLHWDPALVRGHPEAAGEYDGYVLGVLRELMRNDEPGPVARYLAELERDSFGLSTDAAQLEVAARRLLAWRSARVGPI